MAQLWSASKPMSVRDVMSMLSTDRPLAYTTVMTVLDRLAKKGVAQREASGRMYLYRAAISRVDLAADQMEAALKSSEDRDAALLRFVDRMEPHEIAALRDALNELDQSAET